ncbi:hypothetical protein M3Y94_00108600 [Aphelenchoides besseyi]|nr:hypothetical protein M3Y94_00108600 [Aphelenchoides besseyi]
MATRHIKRGRLRGKPIECNSFVLPYRLTWCVPSLNGRFIELRQFDKKKKRQSSAYHSTLNENLIDDFINLKKAPESGTSKEVRKCLRIDLADVIHGKHIRFEDHENDGEKLIEYRFFDEKCDSLMLFYSKQDDKTVWLTTARLNFPKAGIEVDRDRAIKIDDLTGSKLRGRIFLGCHIVTRCAHR